MTSETTDSLCESIELGQHLYKLVWHDTSQQAVDAWFKHMVRFYENSTPTDTLRVIVCPNPDLKKLPSLAYIMKRSRELQKLFPQRAKTRTAILMKKGLFAFMVNNIARLTRARGYDIGIIFGLDEYERAKAWVEADT